MLVDIIYNMPNWLLMTCILSITVVFAVLGLLIVRNLISDESRAKNNEIVIGLGHQAGVVFAIIVGFVAISVLGVFDKAILTTANEANFAGNIYINSRAYPADFENKLRTAVEDYLNNVINVGWPAQQQGKDSLATMRSLENLYRLLIDYTPNSTAQQAIHTKNINAVSALFDAARGRTYINTHGLHSTVYWMIFFSTLIIFSFAWSFGAKSSRGHLILTAMLGISIGLAIFLIVAFDYPFRGEVSVGPESFQEVLNHIHRLKVEQPSTPGV